MHVDHFPMYRYGGKLANGVLRGLEGVGHRSGLSFGLVLAEMHVSIFDPVHAYILWHTKLPRTYPRFPLMHLTQGVIFNRHGLSSSGCMYRSEWTHISAVK